VGFFIVHGAKEKDDPITEKCADCQQEKKPDELITIKDNNQDIKVCQACKTKRDNKPTEGLKKCSKCGKDMPPMITKEMEEKKMCGDCLKKDKPTEEPNQPNPENIKKWGADFGQLKPGQREGRTKTQNSWSQGKSINFVCLHCQKSFPMDKSIENYLEARQKAQSELNTHKSSCPLKNSEQAKSKLQKWWEGKRKSKTRIIKSCEKCWGKVLWDKKIKDVETARKQALSDLKYHQDKECGLEGKKKIAIYHSPNSGGNEHAPIDNSLTDDGIYNEEDEGEVYQEQGDNKDKGTSWTPWIIFGGVAFLLLIIGYIFWRKIKK
jgi:hypothetical protein